MKHLLLAFTLRFALRGQITESLVVDVHSLFYRGVSQFKSRNTNGFRSAKNPAYYFSSQFKRQRNHWNVCARAGGIMQFSSVPNDAQLQETSLDQVEELRRRADELRKEAHLLELSLEESKLRKKNKKEADIQSWINLLFVDTTQLDTDIKNSKQQNDCGLPNASTVARKLQATKFSEEQIAMLMQTLYKRRNVASLTPSPQQQQPDTIVLNEFNISFDTTATDNRTERIAKNQTEADLMGNYMQLLLDALLILDQSDEQNGSRSTRPRWSGRFSSQLSSKLNEWSRMDELQIRRQMDMRLVQARKEMEDGMTSSMLPIDEILASNNDNIRASVKSVPRWIPPPLYTTIFLSNVARLDPLDILAIKERVLSRSRFFCTSSDSFLNIAIYRGNMRSGPSTANPNGGGATVQNFSAVVFDEIQRMLEIEGLANRTQLFLLNDPEWRPNVDERETRPKPVIVALPKELTPYESNVVPSRRVKYIQEMSPLIAACTTIFFSIGRYALNPIVFDGIVNRQDISVLSKCIPIMVIMLGVQGMHEIAHHVVARKYSIMTHWPVLIPSLELGSFGCITRIRSFPPTRTALFDFAMCGPLAATALALSMMIIGCFKTIRASNSILMAYPTVPLASFKSSFLTGTILTVMLPKVMMMPSAHPIPIHPLFVGGYTALITTALNMLPIFRLDGGRACTAIVGTRLGALTSAWTMLSLLSLGLSGSGLAWSWGVFVLLFQRQPEIVSRDDVTPVGKLRTHLWGICLALSLLTLLPFPGGTFL